MEHSAGLTLGQPMTFESLGEGLRSFEGLALRELIRYRAANSISRHGRQREVRYVCGVADRCFREFSEWSRILDKYATECMLQ
jgi:hypothetical protein